MITGGNTMINNDSRPSILESNLFYLFTAVIFLTLGAYSQSKDIYSGLLITEYIIILFPTIFYLKMRGYSLKKVLRLNKITLKQALILPIITIFSYPIGVFFNYLMIIVINLFGKINPTPIPTPESTQEMIIGLFVIAISAGICEEIMFRGFMMKAYEKNGTMYGIISSAILFGLFHFNIQNLLGPIFLGILFGYIVYKTNSIFSGIITHITNNSIALVLSVLVSKVNIDPEATSEIAASGVISDTAMMLIGAIGIGFIAIVSGVIVYFLLKLLPKGESGEAVIDSDVEEEMLSIRPKTNIIAFLPIFVVLLLFGYMTYIYFIA